MKVSLRGSLMLMIKDRSVRAGVAEWSDGQYDVVRRTVRVVQACQVDVRKLGYKHVHPELAPHPRPPALNLTSVLHDAIVVTDEVRLGLDPSR
jgi:hypothetical protein